MRKRIFTLAVVLLPVIAGVGAWAETGSPGYPGTANVQAVGYKPDKQASAAFRPTLAVVDTLTNSGILATTYCRVLGKPNVKVSAWFSASGQTCQVQLAYVYNDGANLPTQDAGSTNLITDFGPIVTLSGGTVLKNAVYPATRYDFDTGGATDVYVILISAPASGTVSLRVGTF